MLVVTFSVAEARYAIACQRVLEVIPLVALRPVPGAPKWLRGNFVYRGGLTPVVDLCQLLGGYACPEWLSSRIVLTDCVRPNGSSTRAGLLTAQLTEARRIEALPLAGVQLDAEPYLGDVLLDGGQPLQFLHPERIVLGSQAALSELVVRGSLTSGGTDRTTAES